MQILAFDQLDSTSLELRRRLEAGTGSSEPLAILARQQTAGRGRLGRRWHSPLGNCYFSFAWNSSWAEMQGQPAMSLRVGACLAAYLESRFAIKPSLKWPNDLIVDGRKLAGILCETFSPAHDPNQLTILIGIGVNLLLEPPDSELEFPATCLQRYCDPEVQLLDPLSFGRDLLLAIEESLGQIGKDQIDNYLIQRGHPVFLAEESRWYLHEGINSLGHLQLRELGLEAPDQQKLRLIESAHDSLDWYFQAVQKKTWPEKSALPPVLLADVGNTRIKLGAFTRQDHNLSPLSLSQQGTLQFSDNDSPQLDPSFASWVQSQEFPVGWPVFVLSVNESPLHQLRQVLASHGLQALRLSKRSYQVDFSNYPLQQLGIDRLAQCEAAWAMYPDQSQIIVSLGTAITVDVLDSQGVFQGGWILAGMQTRLDALAEKTSGLPALSLHQESGASSLQNLTRQDPISKWLGQTTTSSMFHGVLWEAAGAINELSRRLALDWGQPALVVLTGGDHSYLEQHLTGEVRSHPDLTLRGALLLSLAGYSNA